MPSGLPHVLELCQPNLSLLVLSTDARTHACTHPPQCMHTCGDSCVIVQQKSGGWFRVLNQSLCCSKVVTLTVRCPFTKSTHSVQFSSVAQLCPTVCDPMDCSIPASLSIANSRSLLKLMSITLVMPSNHLILCRPLLPLSIFPSIRVFSNESILLIREAKYYSFSFSISPSNDYSGMMSFRIDWFNLLQSKGLSRVFSNTTVQKHRFFSAQLSL